MNDDWYLGFHSVVTNVLNFIDDLNASKIVKNKVQEIKNFLADSNHNIKSEVKIRKKIFLKTMKEIWSLKHLTEELSESSTVEVLFLGPIATDNLAKLSKDPSNDKLRENHIQYSIKKYEVHIKEEKKEEDLTEETQVSEVVKKNNEGEK